MKKVSNKIHEREMDKSDLPGTFNAGATLGPVNPEANASRCDGAGETNMARIWNKHKPSNTPLKRKVFVGMSGGVDSSVAALLLRDQGYDVVGVFMKCFNVDGCAERDAEDARRVAEKLGIPFYVWDFEEAYKKRVVEYMIEGYKNGITPNPDVMCNREIKFGLFLEKALAAGADYVSTGHYVILRNSPSRSTGTGGSLLPARSARLHSRSARSEEPRTPSRAELRELPHEQEGEFSLFQAKDNNKDQSYFLWTLTQAQLAHCLFPIGDYIKPEVRAMARKAGLPTAEKKDSQGICFLGKVTLDDFLAQYIPATKGEVLHSSGKVIGEHKGAYFYTIGQRHGLGNRIKNHELGTKEGEVKPLYVAKKDVVTNTLTVVEGSEHKELYRKEVALGEVNFIDPTHNSQPTTNNKKGVRVLARVRYRQPLAPAILICSMSSVVSGKLIFDEPQKFVAEGQSAVFYSPEGEMIGGGVII